MKLIELRKEDILKFKRLMQEAFQYGYESVYGKDNSQVLPENLGGNHNINGNYYSLDMIAAGGLIDIGYLPASVIDIVLPFMDSVSTTSLQPNDVLFVRTPTTMSNNTLHWITSKELKSLIGRRITIANTCSNKYIGVSNVWVVDGTYDINNNFIENSAEFKTIEIYPNESVTLEFQNITTVKSASKKTEAGDRYKVDLYYPKLCWKLVANALSFYQITT